MGYDLLRARLRARRPGAVADAPVLLNSLPKSGTHLMIRLLEELPGLTRIRSQLAPRARGRYLAGPDEPVIDIGIGSPVSVSRAKVVRTLRRLPRGAFMTAHVGYEPELAEDLAAGGVRVLVMVRDPRDVAVSAARYLASSTGHRLHERFAAMGEADRLLAVIVGVDDPNGPGLRDLRQRVTAITAWKGQPHVAVVRFEDLVGPRGGGRSDAQAAAISAVAAHLGIELSAAEVRGVAGRIYGGTPTFREGMRGTWQAHFGPVHRAAAAALVGDLLSDMGYEADGRWAG